MHKIMKVISYLVKKLPRKQNKPKFKYVGVERNIPVLRTCLPEVSYIRRICAIYRSLFFLQILQTSNETFHRYSNFLKTMIYIFPCDQHITLHK